ncbi:MAG: RNA 2'-phosphotransferase [Promethearchaeia archaeon]
MGNFYVSMSKFLSYILRHHPEKFNIQLDEQGYGDLEKILKVLNNRFENRKITKETIKEMMDHSDKRRFELREQKIRAYYGHSIDKKIKLRRAKSLPKDLYHGTTQNAYKKILKTGLKKRNRQYVHLSKTIKTAVNVGKRRTNDPIILKIDIGNAKKEGVTFYRSGDMYLADYVPPKFIEKIQNS